MGQSPLHLLSLRGRGHLCWAHEVGVCGQATCLLLLMLWLPQLLQVRPKATSLAQIPGPHGQPGAGFCSDARHKGCLAPAWLQTLALVGYSGSCDPAQPPLVCWERGSLQVLPHSGPGIGLEWEDPAGPKSPPFPQLISAFWTKAMGCLGQ